MRRGDPVVVHVGYHKTATTWLQEVFFSSHPALELITESRYPQRDPFLAYLIGSSDRSFDPDQAWELLAPAAPTSPACVPVISAERLSGHAHSGGYDQLTLARRLKAVLPAARLVCVIRSQQEMLESVYRQLVIAGYPGRFRTLLDRSGWTTPWFDLDFYEYDRVLTAYRSVLGADQVLMLRFEELRADPEAFLGALCAFAGVDAVGVPTGAERNRAVPAEALLVGRILNRFRRTERNPFPIVPLPEGIFGRFMAAGARLPRTRRTLVGREDLERIEAHYRSSNDRLSTLLAEGSHPS